MYRQRRTGELERMRKLRKLGFTTREIAQKVGMSHKAVNSAIRRMGLCKSRSQTSEVIRDLLAARHHKGDIAAKVGVCWDTVYQEQEKMDAQHAMEIPEYKMRQERAWINRTFGKGKTGLIISDPHFPAHCPPALEAALKDKTKFDYAVLSGDKLDQHTFSRFRDETGRSLAKERMRAMEWEERIRDKCGYLIEFDGNHDLRVEKHLDLVLKGVRAKAGEEADEVFDEFAAKFRSWRDGKIQNVYHHHGWWIRLGNCIVAHPERYTKNRLSAAKNVMDHFHERGEKGINSFMMGHTHRMVPPTLDRGVWLCELPACCKRMSYMNSPKAFGGALHVGYTILKTDDKGDLVPNESRTMFVAAL